MTDSCYSEDSYACCRPRSGIAALRSFLLLALSFCYFSVPAFGQPDCCPYLTPTLQPGAQDCCFDFYVNMQSGIPCEITMARITVSAPAFISGATAQPSYTLTQSTSQATWDRNAHLLDFGNNYLGTICFAGANPCVDVIVDYWDFNTSRWVCSQAIQVCCDDKGKSECCEYLTPEVKRIADEDCCFDFFVEMDQDIPCEITQARIEVLAPASFASYSATAQFTASQNGNVVTWDKNATLFDVGTNHLGTFCLDGADPCATIVIQYYDFNTDEWVCCDTLEICCAIDPPGELCGTKFEDLDCDGERDDDEPGLEGWTITIVNKDTGDMQSVQTDADGNYCFSDLPEAHWCVYETQQDGWAQTLPATVFYDVILSAGQQITGLDFGNIRICEEPESVVTLDGNMDDFDTSDGAEPTSPGADLLTYINARYPNREPNFDGTTTNRSFGHTFNGFLPPGCCVVGARLRIRVQALGGASWNDGISLIENGQRVWSSRIGNIVGYAWNPGSIDIINLDLAALPSGTVTNILAALQDGDLDIYIQDDTSIDWAELTVDICCEKSECCEFLEASLPRTADEDQCCFDFFVEMDQGIPCEITMARIEVLGGVTFASYTGTAGFSVSQVGNVVTWDKNATLFNVGSNHLGTFCLDGADPCATVVVQYFDFNWQRWVCCDTIEICCPIDPPGELCGTKFEDLDCDGERDADEPGLEGWTITIVNKDTGDMQSVQTDADGNYCFSDLPEARWCVYETQQAGWAQTLPASVYYDVTLSAGQTINGLDFGNIRICEEPESVVLLDGNGASTPGADLLTYIAATYPNREPNFDGTTSNRSFGHTFSGYLPPGCCVVGARLRIAVDALAGASHNDALVLLEDGQRIWSSRIGTILGYAWNTGSSDIISLDLAALPSGTVTNIIAALQDGDFDFFIQDDTSIDWAELTVDICCEKSECCEFLEASLPRTADEDQCCFDFFVEMDQGIPCEITMARIELLGGVTFASFSGTAGFSVSQVGNVVTWDKNATLFDVGTNYLGTFCLDGADPCATVVVQYFDFNWQRWVCCDTIEICCPIDPPGELCGTKFEDLDCNGERDDDEPGLANWTITIVNKDTGDELTTTTDVNGDYCFSDLPEARWCVYETQQAGWAQTLPASVYYDVTLSAGQTINGLDFGNIRICEEPESVVLLDGNGASTPGADLLTYIAATYPNREPNFDGTTSNRSFGHTFSGYLPPGCCVVGARLRIAVDALAGASHNDALVLLEDGQRIWASRIGTILGYAWNTGSSDIISLDLAALPSGTVTNIIAALQDGDFDFFIQDDTSIDWAELTVDICCEKSECCEYLEASLPRTPDQDQCCFDFFVEMDQGIPCEITMARIELLGGVTFASFSGTAGFSVSQVGNVVTWDKNATLFDVGTNHLGTFCIDGADPCATVVVQYFDFNWQRWVCCDTIEICCPIDPPGELCGTKWEDLNCDGVRDPNEPGLEDWEITIFNKDTGDMQTTTTDADGNYCFTDLPEARWCVYETQQTGWAQTFPPTAYYRVTLSAGETINGLDFGNIRKCEEPVSVAVTDGNMDDFDTSDGAEPASPGADLLAFINSRTPRREANFDGTRVNRMFGHTFTGYLPPGCCAVEAILTLRVRALGESCENDGIGLLENGQVIWYSRISNIVGSPWTAGSTAIINLDLSNLPSGTVTNILAAVQDGDFDFYVQDDTSVDWATLSVEICCDEQQSECCDYMVPTLKWDGGKECCYELNLDVNGDPPCEITEVRITTSPPVSISTATPYGGFNVVSQSTTQVSFEQAGGFMFTSGSYSIGLVCFDGITADQCGNIRVDYFDFNTGQWICGDDFVLCCSDGGRAVNVEERAPYANLDAGILSINSVPNPADDATILNYDLQEADDIRLRLFDPTGQVVGHLDSGYRPEGQHSLSIETGTLAAGQYYVQLSTSKGAVTYPLLIVR